MPYQVDGSKIIVRVEGGIAANSSHIWMIAPGARSAAAQVSVTDGGTYYQIDNGLIAVRTPKTIPVSTPAVLLNDTGPPASLAEKSMPLLRYLPRSRASVIATGRGPALVPTICILVNIWHSTQIPDPILDYTNRTAPTNFPAKSATVEVLENGPLRAKIKVTYAAVRPASGI